MKYPTEEEIQQVISELQTSAQLNHEHGNKEEGCCDMCSFVHAMGKRSEDGSEPCEIDKLAIGNCMANPMFGIMVRTIPNGVESIFFLARVCFLVGMMTGKLDRGTDELEKMFKG